MIHALGTFALDIAAFAFVAFVVLYGVLADWRSNPWGRAVMRFHAGFAVILVYVVLVSAGIHLPTAWNAWVRLVLYGIVAILGCQQLYMMTLEQVRARRKGNHRRERS